MTAIDVRSFRVLVLFGALVPMAAGSTPRNGSGARLPAFSVERVATMQVARSVHTATTLRSGHVLIVGGMATGGRSVALVELFDPATNAIEETASLGTARASHTATLLRDGRLLVTGGYHGEYLRSSELYEPATKQFRPAPALTEPRSGHTATLLLDGRVLIVGGVGTGWTFLRSAELYDPASGRSAPVGSMYVPREGHTATLLADGRVLIVGGHNGRRSAMEVYSSAELFDPRTRRFTPAGGLVTARHKHDAVRLSDGRVLVVGGADRTDRNFFRTTEIFSPTTGTFEAGPSMRSPRYKIATTSILLPDGDVLVTSGARTAEFLDHESGVFRELPGTLSEAYRFAAATPISDGDVFLSGGYADGVRSTAGVWRLRRGR